MSTEYVRRESEIEEGILSYLVRAGKEPPLILIPGSFSDSSQWDDVIPALSPNLMLVLVELRGHGKSRPPPLPIYSSIEQFTEDVFRVVDDLSLTQFFIGGHSIGGMIALEAGRQRPADVTGIISIEGWTHCQVAQDAFGGMIDDTLSQALRIRKNEIREKATGDWSEEQRANFRRIWKRWDGYQFLATTEIPILELWGDRGKQKPSLSQMRIPERENITVRWFENASHELLLEHPQEVARAIMDFLVTPV